MGSCGFSLPPTSLVLDISKSCSKFDVVDVKVLVELPTIICTGTSTTLFQLGWVANQLLSDFNPILFLVAIEETRLEMFENVYWFDVLTPDEFNNDV